MKSLAMLKERERFFNSMKRCGHSVALDNPNGCRYCEASPKEEAERLYQQAVKYMKTLAELKYKKEG